MTETVILTDAQRDRAVGAVLGTAVGDAVALASLHDELASVQAARVISELAHSDPETGDAAVLWCTAVRHAVLTGVLDLRIGLGHLDSECRDQWAVCFVAAERADPSDFAVKTCLCGRVGSSYQARAALPSRREASNGLSTTK